MRPNLRGHEACDAIDDFVDCCGRIISERLTAMRRRFHYLFPNQLPPSLSQ